ncbi:MAG: hypothetical protein HP493_00085 [Nitrospira sp.]|nr:hypothetical protein [Nitrospira sp.]
MTRLSTARRFFHALALAGFVCSATQGFADDELRSPDNATPAQSDTRADSVPVEATPAQSETRADSIPVKPPPSRAETVTDPVRKEANPSITLKASVWRTKPGIVFLKTPIGLLTLSSKTTLKDFLASQDVFFWIHDTHLAIEIRKRSNDSLVHRYLSGPFKRSGDGENKLLRWTPEGERSFDFGAHERSLAGLREGSPITVEVTDNGTVIGVHDLQFDLQIGQIASGGSDAQVLLTGTVSKLKSNFIFFRTPVGVVNVNAKIGIKNAKVGQTLTLRIHRRNVVADLVTPNTASSTRRFVTGPLEFASPDRAGVKLWTPEGEQIYPTDRGKPTLAGLKEGSPITVELDGHGEVVEFHRLN